MYNNHCIHVYYSTTYIDTQMHTTRRRGFTKPTWGKKKTGKKPWTYYVDCWHCSSRNILRHRVALPSYVFTIDLDYMDCWHCSSRNILRHRVALPSYVFTIDLDYMDCWHCSSRNILRHRVALPSYVFTIVRARAHRFGPWYNQSFWYNTTVYVSYIVETEVVNANNICRKL